RCRARRGSPSCDEGTLRGVMIRYWYALLHGRFKLWQVLALGMMWIGGGVALQVALRGVGGGMGLGPGLLLYGSGALHFWLAYKAVKEHRALDEMEESVAEREARLAAAAVPPKRPGTGGAGGERPLPPPPRI